MKLLTIFKKEKNTTIKAQAQKLDKTQLSQVIGGGDGTIDTTMDATKTRAKIIMDRDSG